MIACPLLPELTLPLDVVLHSSERELTGQMRGNAR